MTSMQERLQQIQDKENANRLTAQTAQGEEQKAKSARYQQERDQARRTQALLLEELREQEVLGLVEELTGPIFPLRDASGNYILKEPTDEDVMKRAIKTKQLSEGGLYPEYQANVDLLPQVNEDGSANPDLHIMITHNRYVGIPNMGSITDGYSHNTVFIKYGEDRSLSISGENITFSGLIPPDPTERMDKVGEAFAQALAHPKRVSKAPFPDIS